MSAKEFVAPGRSLAADHINFKIGIPESGNQVVEQVEYPGIILMNFAGAVVAQITVQPRQGFRIVAVTVAVDDCQALSSVAVEEVQTIEAAVDRMQFWLGRPGHTGENQRKQKKSATIPC